MKKNTKLYCTQAYMYLTELPVIYLIYLCIKHNGGVEGPLKLYPLIIALFGVGIYMFVFLFRIIIISYDTIQAIGPYSSREKALINEGKSLVLTLLPRGKIKVELFGICDNPPELDWAKSEDYSQLEVNLFRDRAVGGKRGIRRVLNYFEVPNEDIDLLLNNESFEKSYKSIDLSSESKNEIKEIKIRFTETV